MENFKNKLEKKYDGEAVKVIVTLKNGSHCLFCGKTQEAEA
jgi:hypothetical protein